MNKIKEAIQKLRAHLGSDQIGIRLLDAVTRIANDQRTQVATLEQEAAADRDLAKVLRNRLDEAENRVAALKDELIRQTAMREAAQSSERAMRAQMIEPESLESMETTVRVDQILALLRNARRRFKRLPVDRLANRGCLYLEDFVKTFAYDEFAGLGMALAACAVMNLPPPPLRAENTLKNILGRKWEKWKNKPELARFVNWAGRMLCETSTNEKILDMMNLPRGEQVVLHNTRGFTE